MTDRSRHFTSPPALTEKRGAPPDSALRPNPPGVREPRRLTILLLAVAALLGLFLLGQGNALAQTAGITIAPATLGALTEAAGAAHSRTFTVALNAEPTGDVTLTLTHGDDVSLDQTTLTFTSVNWSAAQTVTVTAVDDSIDEASSEDFSIALSASGGGYGSATAQVTGSVTDDDTATFTATLDKTTLAEADAGDAAGVATLTVTITNSVSWATNRDIGLTLTGSARVGEDFTLTDGDGWTLSKPFILRFGAGATETTAIIGVIDDAHDDDDETVSIAVDADGAAIRTVGPLTLTDDDDPPLTLSALAVTTAATRQMYPAFAADTFHYAVGCETDDAATTGKLTVALSAADATTRVSVNGVQAANQNGVAQLTGLDGYSDVKIVLSNASGASTTYTVHCLPKVFLNFVTTKQPGAWDGLMMMGPRAGGDAGYIVIIDNNGVPRFHRHVATGGMRVSHFRTHPNGKYPYSYAVQHGVLRGNRNWEQVVLDHDLSEVQRVRTVGLQHTDNHDFVIRENGNYILQAYEPNVRDMTGYTDDKGNPFGISENVVDAIIQEVTPDGAVVHQVNSWDVFHLEDCQQANGYISRDWAHINSVQAVGDDYIASYRYCNQALRINAQTGKVVWRLGLSTKDDAYWVGRDGKAPLKIVGDPYGEFCWQHSARLQPNGHLMLYDNGGSYCSGPRPPKQFSRALEYALDLEQGEATFVRHHSIGGEFKQFAPYEGIVEVMGNGNWLISWGGSLRTAVTEVIPGPRWSETQGQQRLSVKISYNGNPFAPRTYPLSPGTLERAWPPGALTEQIAESASNSSGHLGTSDTVNVVVAFSRPVVDFAANTPSVSVTGATVKSVTPHIVPDETAHAYLFELTPTGDSTVEFVLVTGQVCNNGGICAKDGSTLSTVRTKRTVPRIMEISGLANASVAENTAYGPVTPSVAPTPTGSATWSLEGDDADDFTINSGTGALSMVARDFETPADADGDNVYEVTVRVTDTAGRTDAQSIEVTVTDVNEPPGVPAGLTLSAASGSLTATWSAGAAPAGTTPPATTAYNVQYRLSSDTAWVPLTPGRKDTSATIDGLTGGSTYDVRVRAKNPEDRSAWTVPVSGTPTAAGITADPQALGALIEAAGAAHSASFTVALDAQPSGDVTLTLTHGADVSLDQATLSFTSANWNSAQTVTVTAVDDSIDEAASESFSIDLSASGGGYDGVTAQVTGSVTDDDTAAFTATLDNNNTLAEADAGDAAGVATLTVTITNSVSWPEDRDIGLTLTGNARVGEDFTLTDGDGWTLSKPFILRFGAGATETTAIIGVIDDAHDDDDETVSIAVDADGAAIDTVGPLTLTDNDGPPLKLSALGVTTASDLKMYPAFAADTFHYAVGCETEDAQTTGKLTVTLSAADANTRVAVNGVQVASQNGETELTGLNGYSDVKIVLSNASGASTTYTVHCLPKVFLNFVTTKQPGAWEGLITISGWNVPGNAPPYIAIIDNNGVPRFHRGVATNNNWVIQFRTHKKGKYPYSYAVQHGVSDYDRNYEQVVLDHDLTEVARIRTAGLQQTDSHDFVIRENGNYVLLAYEPNVRNMTGYTDMEGNPFGSSANVIDSIIQEVTPAGQQVHIVNSWDVLDLDDCKQGRNGPIHDDYAHINSVQVVGGDYITSYRHCSQALRINAQTGKVVWRLGLSRKSDAYWIARDGRAPLKIVGDPYGEFCGQHSPRMIANGNLILFDNGGRYCNGARKPKQFSRAVEYALDLERGTATFVRHHFLGGAPDNYAISRGIIELMDNGNWLLSWGTKLDPAVTEVIPGPRGSETQGQQLLSVKLSYPDTSIQTRAYPLSPGTLDKAWPPGPPEELIAESAYNSTVHLGASDTVNVVVAFSRPVVDFAANTPSISVTGATVKSVAPHIVADEAAYAYLFELTPAGDSTVEFVLVAGQGCAAGGICAKDGSTLSTVRTKRSVAAILAVSGLANASVAENTAYGPVTPSVAPTPTGSATWSLEGDDADDFTINSGTGALSMVARDFETPADADGDNVYEVTVRVTDTAGRTGAQSIQVTVNDADEPPGVPTGLTLSAAIGSLTATWNAGAAPAGSTPPATTAYNVQYRLSSDTAWTLLTPSPTAASSTIDGLTGGSAYEVRVRAVNPEGSSAWTTPVSGTPTAAGITVNPQALGALTEAAGAAHSRTFTVALNAEPTGDVTLTLTHGDDVSLDQTTLTFTSVNWSAAQTVTVTAVDDSIDEAASEDFSIALSASGGGYGSATAQVTGSVTDDDTATFTATLDKTTLAEADAGDAAGVATLTVTITNSVSWATNRDIGLTLTGSARVGEDFTLTDGDGWTLSKPFILRFGAGATETTAIIGVIDDAHDDDDETVSIAVDADGAAIRTVGPLTLTDDDDPPLTLSALAVTTAATRQMYPAFAADTFHYAVGCETDDAATTGKLTVALSAADATTRVSVNGVQAANQNGVAQLTGLDGYSDVKIVLSNASGANTTYTVHCLPKVFPVYETTKQAGAWGGLMTFKGNANDNATFYVVIIDTNGVPRFHRKAGAPGLWPIQFRTHKRGKYPYSYASPVSSFGAGVRDSEQVILNHDLTEFARVRAVGLQHTDVHDFVIRENGNYIFLSYEPKVRDLTGYLSAVNPDVAYGSSETVRDSVIQEQTPQGVKLHEVNSWDLFHLDDCKVGAVVLRDWAHVNSLQAVGNDYIASYKFCHQVLRINKDTGKVVWRLGKSKKSDEYWIARDGRAPLKIVGDPYGEFCGQHSARVIANNHLLIYDNGGRNCNGDREPGKLSRVVEYALDLEQGTATFVRHHSLRGELSYYGFRTGVIELMDSGNWLISWGSGSDTSVTEVIPGPRWSETQGTEILTVKSLAGGGTTSTRSYPVSPGALDHAWAPGAPEEVLAESASNSSSHLGVSDTVNVVVAFSRPVVDFAANTPSVSVTGATVKSVTPHIVPDETAHAYLFELTPTGDAAVEFVLVTGQVCNNGGICAKDGSTLSNVRTKRTVPRIMEISGLANASVAENTAYGPVTPSVAPTPTGSATWSLEGDDADDFTINSGTGALSMVARDFETPADADGDNVYEVTVRVSAGANSATVALLVTVRNMFELFPAILGPTSFSYAENGALRASAYSVTSPEDQGGAVWSLSGTDSGDFSIEDGILRFVFLPDYESPSDDDLDTAYTVTVTASDGDTPPATRSRDVTVTVTNEEEPGVVTLSPLRPRAGMALTASLTDPDGSTSGVAWSWERSTGPTTWAAIDGADSSSYTPVAADAGAYLRATVTYTDGHGAGKSARRVSPYTPLTHGLSALSVTGPARGMYPAFDPEVLHYAMECVAGQTTTLTLSAAGSSTRVAVNGIQRRSQNAVVELTGLAGDSDILITLSDGQGGATTYVLHCFGEDFPNLVTTKGPGATEELILFSLHGRTPDDSKYSYLMIVDNNGVPRIHRRIANRVNHFRPQNSETYPFSYSIPFGPTRDVWILTNRDLTDLDQVTAVSPLTKTDRHDFFILDNGDFTFLSYEPMLRDLSFLTDREGNSVPVNPERVDGKYGMRDTAIQIRTPSGVAKLTWYSWDHVVVQDCDVKRNPDDDYAHGNSLWMDNGVLVVSLRGCSKVLGIDESTGEVVWRLGRSYRNPEEWGGEEVSGDGRGSGPAPLTILNDPYGEFCKQHSAQILDNGHLLLYDNGVECVRDPATGRSKRTSDVFSRAVEYAIDPDNGEATFLRHHSLHGAFNRMGDSGGLVQLMENGDWLISWGRGITDDDPTTALPPDESVTQVDPATGAEKFSINVVLMQRQAVQVRAYPLSPVTLAKAPGPLEEQPAVSASNSNAHLGTSDTVNVVVAFSRPVVDFAANTPSVSVTGATVKSVAPHIAAGEAAHAYLFELTPAGDAAVEFVLVAGQACTAGGICAKDGSTLSTVRTKRSVPRATAPGAPTGLSATTNGQTRIDLSWTAPGNGGSAITGYRLERKTGAGSYAVVSSSIAANATSYADSSLSAGTAYTYRIRAVNGVGNGGWSNEPSAATANAANTVPEAVADLAATSAGASVINLKWTAPGDGGSVITGYRLERKTASGGYTPVSSSIEANATSYQDTGLSAGTAYTYRIRAVNGVGNGGWSNEPSAATANAANTVPEAVADLAATSASTSVINLMWTAPGNGGSAITGYRLDRKTGSGDYAVVSSNIAANATSYQDTGLTAATTYTYRIRAVNGVGNGGWSNEPSAATANAANTAPEAVDDLAATSAGASVINLMWTAPGNGGSAITGYRLDRKTGSGDYAVVSSNIAANATSYQDTGLTAATTYTYRIRAVNAVGNGGWSNEAGATTANAAPEAVDDLAATSAGTSVINLMWTAPGNGGSAITGYRLDRKTGSGDYAVVSSNIAANATSYQDTGLTAATTYTYRIRAVNGVGNGGWSNEPSAATANTAPEAVDDLAATSAGASVINLMWTAPGNGGSAITGYRLDRKTGSGDYAVVSSNIAANATSYQDTGLTAATTYTYRIRAVNGVGNGGWSNEAGATTANAAPEAVDDLAATSAGTSAINLKWTAPGNGGSDITGYRLERKTGSGDYAVVPSSILADATSYSDTGLTAATAYTYRIRAVNGVGNGGWSNEPSAATANAAPSVTGGGGGGGGGGSIAAPANREPVFIDGLRAVRSVPEGMGEGASIGEPVAATDRDNDTLTYTLRDVDADFFGIDRRTGQLLVKAALDYETKASYSLWAHVSDGKGGSDTIDLTVMVTDVDEPPAIAGPLATEYAENRADAVAAYTAVDPEGTEVTWSLAGDDAGAFTVSGAGALAFNAPPDYEAPADADTDNVYQVMLQATDLKGMMGMLHMVVSVTDVENEGIWTRYDFNNNGLIERDEALAAVFDYFADLITKQQALEVVFRYFAS